MTNIFSKYIAVLYLNPHISYKLGIVIWIKIRHGCPCMKHLIVYKNGRTASVTELQKKLQYVTHLLSEFWRFEINILSQAVNHYCHELQAD